MPKTPAQKVTERHEDALMQKAILEDKLQPAGAASEGHAEVAVSLPSGAGPPVVIEEVLLLDESVPYASVRGVPGVEYVQGRDYYGRDKRMVREAPAEQWYFSDVTAKKVSDMDRADAARRELRAKGLWEDVPRLPKAILDIEKENARAAAAEQHAA